MGDLTTKTIAQLAEGADLETDDWIVSQRGDGAATKHRARAVLDFLEAEGAGAIPAAAAVAAAAEAIAAVAAVEPVTRAVAVGLPSPQVPGVIVAVVDPTGRMAPLMREDGRLLQLTADGTVETVPTHNEAKTEVAPLWGLIQGERPVSLTLDDDDRVIGAQTLEGSTFVMGSTGLERLIPADSSVGTSRVPLWGLIAGERPTSLTLDSQNRIIGAVTLEGSTFALGPSGLERVSADVASVATATVPEYLGQLFAWGRYQTLHAPGADVCLILLTMGQSNASGVNASSDTLPGATPIYPDEALMLAGSSPRANGTSLIVTTAPLAEAAVSGERETAASALAATLIRDLETATGRRVRTLSAVCAQGGLPYRGLSRGSAPYTAMIASVRSMVAICRERGWTPICPGVDWMQGESDAGGPDMDDGRTSSLPASDYVRGMRQFARQLSADIRAVTGQAEDVPVYISQIARSAPTSTFGLWYRSAREAQRELHGQDNIRLVGPGYPFDYGDDGLHLVSAGQNGRGQQVARAMMEEAFGAGWSPVIDRAHRWASATQIDVEFEVPTLPLVLDTSGAVVATTGLATTMGFHFDDGSGAPPAISSVALLDDRTVRITLAAAPAGFGSCRLGYALDRSSGSTVDGRLTGSRGLLRDSRIHPSAYGLPSQANWCVSFIRDLGRP